MADERVAIVTGGAQGLGAEIAKLLLKDGYKVCVADVQEEKGKEFVHSLTEEYGSNRVCFVHCNVTQKEEFHKVFHAIKKELGEVTLLVSNAGILDEHNPQKMININLMGAINGCQTALDLMGKTNGGRGGVVLLTASLAGLIYHHALPAYVASKHGVVGLTRSYGTPYYEEKEGVIFMALCPSVIDTPLMQCWKTNSAVEGYDVDSYRGILNSECVAEAAMQMLKDRRNGSTLLVSKEKGNFYVELADELKSFQI